MAWISKNRTSIIGLGLLAATTLTISVAPGRGDVKRGAQFLSSVEGPPTHLLPAPEEALRNVEKVPPVVPLSLPANPDVPPFTPSNVNVSNLMGNEAEVSIDVNPTNPDNLVVAGHAPGFATMNTFFSMDGGETWDLVALGNADDGLASTFRFDPTVAFDDDGNVYVGYGAGTVDAMGNNQVTVVVCRSTDGGQSYPQCALISTTLDIGTLPGNDKWHLATGPDPVMPSQQNVYIAWTQNIIEAGNVDQRLVFSRSTNGGAVFSAPLIIADDAIGGIDRALFADPAVGPNGEVYVAWHDFGEDEILIDVSFDGGMNFGTDMLVSSVGFSGLFEFIPAQPDRGITVGPTIDTDRSGGPFDGRLYITYTDVGAGGLPDTDVFLRYSDDDGMIWTAATLVNDDGGLNSQFLPWLDVDNCSDSLGRVAVCFYDARNDPGNQLVEVFLAVSEDGGVTFEPNVLVSAGQSDQSANNPFAWSNNFLEYIGVAVCDNVACLVWADNSADPADLDYFSDCVCLIDETPPEIACPPDVTVTCGDSTDPDELGFATAVDDCDPDPVIDFEDVEIPTTCPADPVMFDIVRTWTTTDASGNFNTCVQLITVEKVVLDLDIKPGSCPNSYNRNSHGVLPVGLLGSDDFDVTTVDLSSLLISRADCIGSTVAPIMGPPGPQPVLADVGTPFKGDPCDCHELEGDRIIDWSLKFSTPELVDALELDGLPAGFMVELVVSGQLDDGCGFIATDCVRLVRP